jgi:hypothetical protein
MDLQPTFYSEWVESLFIKFYNKYKKELDFIGCF